MKSLALSLLVALGVSLAAVTASADAPQPPPRVGPVAELIQRAQAHEQRAKEYRIAERVAARKASASLKVVEADLKQGYTYEAGVEREKAAKYQKEAQLDRALAQREDAAAAQCRAEARRAMAGGQPAAR